MPNWPLARELADSNCAANARKPRASVAAEGSVAKDARSVGESLRAAVSITKSTLKLACVEPGGLGAAEGCSEGDGPGES